MLRRRAAKDRSDRDVDPESESGTINSDPAFEEQVAAMDRERGSPCSSGAIAQRISNEFDEGGST